MIRKYAFLLLMLTALLLPASGWAATSDVPEVTVAPSGTERDCGGNHSWETRVVQEATCTERGWSSATCRVCGESKREPIPPLGHDYVKIAEVGATCKNGGSVTWRCSRCGDTRLEETKALGHQYGDPKVDIPATCTEAGRSVRVCRRNEAHIWYGEIPALGHDFGPWQSVNGVRTRTCARCGLTETEADPSAPAAAVTAEAPLPGAVPSVSLRAESPGAMNYGENDRIPVQVVLTNTGTVSVWVKSLAAGTGDRMAEEGLWALELRPGESRQDTLLVQVTAGDAPGYADWLRRDLTCVCADARGTECRAQCPVIIPRLRAGASLLLIPEDTGGITVTAGSTCPVDLYLCNNGTVPLWSLQLQSLDAFGAEAPQDRISGAEGGTSLTVGALLPLQLRLTVRAEDAADGIAWREIRARAVGEDGTPVSHSAPVALVVDTLAAPSSAITPLPEVVPGITPLPRDPGAITPLPQVTAGSALPGGDTGETEAREGLSVPILRALAPVPASMKLTVTLAAGSPETFEPGENAAFDWTLENTGGAALTYGTLLTTLSVPYGEPGDADYYTDKTPADTQSGVQLLPGETLQGTFSLPVTEDPEGGDAVLFYFVAVADREDGLPIKSNVELAMILLTEKPVTVVKEILTSPKNGGYYTEGEKITYRITAVNETRGRVDKVTLSDPLAGSAPLAEAHALERGESLQAVFDYTVTGPDVDAGKVINTAVCDYSYLRQIRQVPSNTVTALTGRPAKADHCVPTLTGTGDGETELGLTLCRAHRESALRARALMAESPLNGPAAAALMTNAVFDLYRELYAKTGSSAFLQEQAALDALLESTRAFLAGADPGDGTAGYGRIIQLLTEKCVNLCYELHTAPGERTDSLFTPDPARAALPATAADRCLRAYNETENGALIREHLCSRHRSTASFLMEAALSARTGNARASLLRSAGILWQTEADLQAQQGSPAGGEKARALSALGTALSGYLKARETCLALLYPARQDIAAEVLTAEARAWTVFLCEWTGK